MLDLLMLLLVAVLAALSLGLVAGCGALHGDKP